MKIKGLVILLSGTVLFAGCSNIKGHESYKTQTTYKDFVNKIQDVIEINDMFGYETPYSFVAVSASESSDIHTVKNGNKNLFTEKTLIYNESESKYDSVNNIFKVVSTSKTTDEKPSESTNTTTDYSLLFEQSGKNSYSVDLHSKLYTEIGEKDNGSAVVASATSIISSIEKNIALLLKDEMKTAKYYIDNNVYTLVTSEDDISEEGVISTGKTIYQLVVNNSKLVYTYESNVKKLFAYETYEVKMATSITIERKGVSLDKLGLENYLDSDYLAE